MQIKLYDSECSQAQNTMNVTKYGERYNCMQFKEFFLRRTEIVPPFYDTFQHYQTNTLAS